MRTKTKNMGLQDIPIVLLNPLKGTSEGGRSAEEDYSLYN